MKNIDDVRPFLYDCYIDDDLTLDELYKNKLLNIDNNIKIADLSDNPYFYVLNDFDTLMTFINYIIDICSGKNPDHISAFDDILSNEIIDYIFSNNDLYERLTGNKYNERYSVINKFKHQ